jgi:uncharacterized protein
VFQTIHSRLQKLENEENIRILYACESGSRIWGFASHNSDWDVRFIYVRPLKYYLSISTLYGKRPDTIEKELEKDTNIDLAGWDLLKALYLLHKTNCPLAEWFDSSICYKKDERFFKMMVDAICKFYSRKKALHHYYHMTQGNVSEYLLNRDNVWTKKYIYILRTLLCCEWLMTEIIPAPASIHVLISKFSDNSDIWKEIHKLIERKVAGDEMGMEPANYKLNNFIMKEMSKVQQYIFSMNDKNGDASNGMDYLDDIFFNFV